MRLIGHLGGRLLLFVVALLLLVGWQLGRSWQAAPDAAAGTAPAEREIGGPASGGDETAVDLATLPTAADARLAPALAPHTLQLTTPAHNFITYTVRAGDTPNGIAERFGIKPETLLGGNAFLSEESSLLQTDVVLTILPIDGVLHTVQPGETLESLARRYGIAEEVIVAYEPNRLAFPYRLQPRTAILIPGAVREVFVWTPPTLPEVASRGTFAGSQAAPIIVGTGAFNWPIAGRRITQFYWYGHQGLDVAVAEGSAVLAADTGTVTYAGWNAYGYGFLVVVNHGNGYETLYAHLSRIDVVPGQIVYKGNLIAGSGNTGRSSGPHIHFEIRRSGARLDPLALLP